MPHALDKLTIKGFKSIRLLENFELSNLNVLIGGNGAGKSNFIDFFRLLRAMLELSLPNLETSNLKAFTEDCGGSDDLLFNGPKITKQIEAELHFGPNGYRFKLAPTAEETFIIPTLIGKSGHKGGDILFDRAKSDIGNLLRQRPNTYISTMFDYFRIEKDWPGRKDVKTFLDTGTKLTTQQKAKTLEDATKKEIENLFPNCNAQNRFIP